jgi:hypothetical protein
MKLKELTMARESLNMEIADDVMSGMKEAPYFSEGSVTFTIQTNNLSIKGRHNNSLCFFSTSLTNVSKIYFAKIG